MKADETFNGKNRNWLKLPFIFLLFLQVSAFAQDYSFFFQRQNLQDGWLWSVTGDSKDFTPVDTAFFSDLTSLLSGKKSGTIFLKNEFYLDDNLKNRDISLYLGKVNFADRTYFNGKLIGFTGSFPPEEFSSWNVSRFYQIPEHLIEPNARNTLLVEIYTNGEGFIQSFPFVAGTEQAKKIAAWQNFINCRVHLLCAFAMLIISASFFLLYLRRTSDKENLYFAAFNLFAAVHLSQFYIFDLPFNPSEIFSYLVFQKIVVKSLPFLLYYLLGSFSVEFLQNSPGKTIEKLRISFTVLPVLAVLFLPNYPLLKEVYKYLVWLSVFHLFYVFYQLILALLRKERNANYLLLAFLPMICVAIADLAIHQVAKRSEFAYFSIFGWILVSASLLFMLVLRFVEEQKHTEQMNALFENMAHQRSLELNRANQILEETNGEFSVLNMDYSEDLALALTVQGQLFPAVLKKESNLQGWQIARTFIKGSKEGGSFFDFYTGKNEENAEVLNGLCLFDINARHVPGVLLGLLAKKMAKTQFYSGLKQPLGQTMECLNAQLLQVLSQGQNFLSGIILRINGERLEYVNAGHSALLCRKAGGEILTANLNEKNIEGTALGLSGLDEHYLALAFGMNAGDCVLLYSNSLLALRNLKGEEYGIEYLKTSFANAKGESAEEKLNYILTQFNLQGESDDSATFARAEKDVALIILQCQ